MAQYKIKSYILTGAVKPTLVVCPIFLVVCHIVYWLDKIEKSKKPLL